MAIIRLSDTKGYYLDIFKAKSQHPEQFHDYVYHNIGDSVSVERDGKKAKLRKDKKRYQSSSKLPWEGNSQYRHPGWHFFDDVRSTEVSPDSYQATFTASKLGNKDIQMKAFIPGGFPVQLTTADAPPAYGAPKQYQKEPLPTMVLRRTGDAWNKPFVVAYESITEGEDYAIQSVDLLTVDNQFKGVKVRVAIDGEVLTQYIISQQNADDVYENKDLGLQFKGRFGLVALNENQQVKELYIGSGDSLTLGDQSLSTNGKGSSAYQKL